jgi:hypothetical protein
MLEQKKEIAHSVATAVSRMKGVSPVSSVPVGDSFPIKLDVPGVWVFGPDYDRRYTVTVSIAVTKTHIPTVADRLRSEIWKELRDKHLDGLVKSVDISVEDLILAV